MIRWSRLGGLGLIEVLISLLLISMSAIGLLKVQSYVLKSAEYSRMSLSALYLAETQLEVFTARSLDGSHGTIRYDSIVSGERTALSGDDEYTLNWIVTPIGITKPNQGKLIDMSASWFSREGSVHSVSLRTFISAYSEFDHDKESPITDLS